MRWRDYPYLEKFAGGDLLHMMRGRDFVADPYRWVIWESDEDLDAEEGEDAEEEGDEGEETEAEEEEESAASAGLRPQAPGQMGPPQQRPPQQGPPVGAPGDSHEIVDSDDEGEDTDTRVGERLATYFPSIGTHRHLVGRPPVAEAGQAWERAAQARDVIQAFEVEVAGLQGYQAQVTWLQGQVTAMQGQMAAMQGQMSAMQAHATMMTTQMAAMAQRSRRSESSGGTGGTPRDGDGDTAGTAASSGTRRRPRGP